MLEKVLVALEERRVAMTNSVFDSPPGDWAAFQKRLGAYVELDSLLTLVKEIAAGKEHDE